MDFELKIGSVIQLYGAVVEIVLLAVRDYFVCIY